MKKLLVFVLVAGLTSFSNAQNEKSELPPQLVQLKKGYEAKVKAAVDPIKREYKIALEKLIKQYGASGNIKFAVEVQKELDSLSNIGTDKKDLEGTTWTWHREDIHETITFTKDTVSNGDWIAKVVFVSSDKLVFILTNKKEVGDKRAEIEFSADRKKFSGTDFGGSKRIQGELVTK